MPQQPQLRAYWENRAHLALVNDLLLYDERIVLLRILRLDVCDCIHRSILVVRELECQFHGQGYLHPLTK